MNDTIPNTGLTPAKKKKHNLLMRIQGEKVGYGLIPSFAWTSGGNNPRYLFHARLTKRRALGLCQFLVQTKVASLERLSRRGSYVLSAPAGAVQAWAVHRASQSLAAAALESQQSSGFIYHITDDFNIFIVREKVKVKKAV